MKILAGDWNENATVVVNRSFGGKAIEIAIQKSGFSFEKLPIDQVETVEILTENNKSSILGKAGWGTVGAIALGPIGLLAGVLGGGNRKERIMVVKFKDGRSAMIKGNAKDAEVFMSAAF